jgi:hypothetical protein
MSEKNESTVTRTDSAAEVDGFETFEAEFTKIGTKVAGPIEP